MTTHCETGGCDDPDCENCNPYDEEQDEEPEHEEKQII